MDSHDGAQAQGESKRIEALLEQSRKMEAIGVFAEGIAHDFNNIMSGILGLAEIVTTRCLPPDNPAKGYLDDIVEAGGKAKELVAQIRRISVSGTQARTVCRLHKILEEVVPHVEETLPKGASLKKEVRWKTADILADAAQIQQMLLNLLTNAVQALDHSPGEIVASLDRVEFTQNLRPHPDPAEGTYARLIVSDTGEGIPPEIMSRIFDPYFTTRKQKGGKGLGLSVAYGIAKRHGGVIAVQSEVGKGSVFTVYLPAICVKERGVAQHS